MATSAKRAFFATEVIQTSAMDCGPACLTSMLNGHGVPVDYGRLREACQTGLDGTSIDVLEEVAGQLGLPMEQTIAMAPDLLRFEAHVLPAVVVTRLPSGALHFIVAWRRLGRWVQIMDPGRGRSWVPAETLERLLHTHSQRIAPEEWREFVQEGPLVSVLGARLAELGLGHAGHVLLREALSDPGWERIAALDATARFVALLVDSGAVARGAEVRTVFPALFDGALLEAAHPEGKTVPRPLWSVIPQGNELVWIGAVALRTAGPAQRVSLDALPPLVRASLENRGVNPMRFVWDLLKPGGLATFVTAAVGIVLGVFGVAAQAFAVRTLVTIDQTQLLTRQRLIGLLAYTLLLVVLASADMLTGQALRRMGRHFESRLWVAFLRKMPRLPERYFQSRLVSDMAERIQSAQALRAFPVFGHRAARAALQLAVAVTAIAVVDARSLPIAAFAFAVAWLMPILWQPSITERDMRLRGHGAALSRFILDSLLGLIPARTHGAERAIRREHENLLAEWVRAGRASLALTLTLQALQSFANAAFLIWLIAGFAERRGFGTPAILVLLYWGAQLPAIAREILALSREYPSLRNVAARLVEPLGAPEEVPSAASEALLYQSVAMNVAAPRGTNAQGVSIVLEDVTVMAGGHEILRDCSLDIAPGSHVAIVGRSGAGKSTLLSLLLGWQQASKGLVMVDSQTLSSDVIEQLRPVTAWVDPGIQLWNRTLLENIRYGATRDPSPARVGSIVTQAELLSVVERLPEGLQTALGESGRLLSGGEGQRVRLARALVRNSARLVLLDEPFRGLERPRRRELLWRARAIWSKATLLCVSHDVSDTEAFDRVIVVDGGRIVEDGSPAALRARPRSVYAQLLAQEELVRQTLFGGKSWRHVVLEDGRIEEPAAEVTAA